MSLSSGKEFAASPKDRRENPKLTVQARARRFVVENFYAADPSEISDDTSLITSGLVDSTGMLEVIAFLESEYGFKIEDREMVPANLETINRIAAFVARKKQPSPS
jgi:acyl carrier protein